MVCARKFGPIGVGDEHRTRHRPADFMLSGISRQQPITYLARLWSLTKGLLSENRLKKSVGSSSCGCGLAWRWLLPCFADRRATRRRIRRGGCRGVRVRPRSAPVPPERLRQHCLRERVHPLPRRRHRRFDGVRTGEQGGDAADDLSLLGERGKVDDMLSNLFEVQPWLCFPIMLQP